MRFLAIFSALIFVSASSQTNTSYPAKSLELFQTYVAHGFDDNDEISFVVEGFLPSTCYKLLDIEAEPDFETFQIVVRPMYKQFTEDCRPTQVPFSVEVRLNSHLPFGTYQIVNESGESIKELFIEEATSEGVDEEFYAPIDHVSVESLSSNGDYYAIIEGPMMNSCIELKEIRVTDSGSSIEILPIIEFIEGQDCHETPMWFRERVNLPSRKVEGRFLVHVRSLDGRAHNYVWNVLQGPYRRFPKTTVITR